MILYLMRHGTAVNVGERGVRTDAHRMLSEEGVDKTRAVAHGLKRIMGDELKRLVSSPLVRARETAEIVAGILGGGIGVETADELSGGADPLEVVAWLRRQPAVPTLLVGHMPDLGALASCLTSGAARTQIDFKKAGVARIVFEHHVTAGHGALEWLLTPGQLRQLGRE